MHSLAQPQLGVVDDEPPALRDDVGDDGRRADAAQPDAVIDVAADADRVAVAAVGRDLGAAHQQEVGEPGLRRRLVRVLRAGVVIRQHDEVEAAAARVGDDLVERGRGVARVARVHVEVAGVPAALAGQHHRRPRRRRLGRQRRGVAELQVDGVLSGIRTELGLADHQLPGARRDRAGQVAARRAGHADHHRLGQPAAPAAEAVGPPQPPVEDLEVRAVVVGQRELDRAGRHVERHQQVVAAGLRHRAGQVQGRDHRGQRQHLASVTNPARDRCANG